jgi:DNA-binding IclR family transcriptional regulator
MMGAPGDSADRPSRPGLSGRQPGAISHALDALEAVAHEGPGVTAQQIAARLGLSPATTYRLLNLLVAEEYIVRLPDLSGFALGRRALEFAGTASVGHLTLSRQARRAVAGLRAELRWGVHVFEYAHGGANVIDADPDHPPHREVLSDAEFAGSAVGRLVRRQRDAEPADVATPLPGDDADASIAAAIRDESGFVIAALVVTGPAQRLRAAEYALVPRLTTAAAELSELMA